MMPVVNCLEALTNAREEFILVLLYADQTKAGWSERFDSLLEGRM